MESFALYLWFPKGSLSYEIVELLANTSKFYVQMLGVFKADFGDQGWNIIYGSVVNEGKYAEILRCFRWRLLFKWPIQTWHKPFEIKFFPSGYASLYGLWYGWESQSKRLL